MKSRIEGTERGKEKKKIIVYIEYSSLNARSRVKKVAKDCSRLTF